MALLKFLKKSSVLPHPNGPLSERVLSSSVAAANKEVRSLVVTPVDGTGVKRGRSNKKIGQNFSLTILVI